MDLAGIHEVEDLHHYECVEDEGKMTRVGMRLLEGYRVILSTFWGVETTTADRTPDDAIVPLVTRVGDV